MTKHNDPQPPLPDILRPTELCDFGAGFTLWRRQRKVLGLILAVAGLWAFGQFAPHEPLDAALDRAVAPASAAALRD